MKGRPKTKEKKELKSPVVRRAVRKEKHWEGAMTSRVNERVFQSDRVSVRVHYMSACLLKGELSSLLWDP